MTVNVLTHHNNEQRTGANTQETSLSVKSVQSGLFAKLWEYPVRGRIYAQPLYVSLLSPALTFAGFVERHFLLIATAENFVYAFDADAKATDPIWRYDAGADLVAYAGRIFLDDLGDGHPQDITPVVGITGTPVVDLPNFTMYFVAMTQLKSDADPDNDEFVQTLHAIDIRTGTLRGKIDITGDIEGGGTFNPRRQNQRAALLLANQRIYIAWAGFGDIEPYDGLIMSYGSIDSGAPLNKHNQFQVARFQPIFGERHKGGGIWQSGGGPALNSQGEFLFVATGNGDSSNDHAGTDFDSSIVKLNLDLNVVDYYTPSFQNFLNENDLDLSVSGPMIPEDQLDADGQPIPLLLFGSKTGTMFVLNRNALGKFDEHDNHIIQSFRVFPDADDLPHQMTPSHIHTTPVYWHGPDGPRVFVASDFNLGVRSFQFQNEKLDPKPVARNFFPRAPITQMSLSSNGSIRGTGVLWAISSPTGTVATYPGILYAFDADTLEVIYTSEASPFDHLGDYPRFTAPTIANGRVYVPTFSNKVAVYSLKS